MVNCLHTLLFLCASSHKVPIIIAADDFFYILLFSKKIRLDVSCESSDDSQKMPCFFSLKNNDKKIECRLL